MESKEENSYDKNFFPIRTSFQLEHPAIYVDRGIGSSEGHTGHKVVRH